MLDVLKDASFSVAPDATRLRCDLLPVTSIFWPDVLSYHECVVRNAVAAVPDDIALEFVLQRLSHQPSEVLACNISARTLECNVAWGRLQRLLQCTPALARRVILEIAGMHLLQDIAGLKSKLAEARDSGCRVAIDEFGTGTYAQELQHALAVDIVKLDLACFQSPRRRRSLHRLVGFAACLAPVVVVKGAERGPFLELMAASGATHVQPSPVQRTA